MSKKYTWTEIGAGTGIDDIWRHDVFSSVEECVKDAIGYGIKPGEKIAVGICENYVPHPSADELLDQVSEDAYEEVGEVAEGWPELERWKSYIGVDELQEKIDKVFNEWLEETNQVPGFYHVQPLVDLVMIPEA